MTTATPTAAKHFDYSGMTFYYETRSFRTSGRAKSVYQHFRSNMKKDAPLSVKRLFDLQSPEETAWKVVVISEDLEVFEESLCYLPPSSRTEEVTDRLLSFCAERRIQYLNEMNNDFLDQFDLIIMELPS